DDRRQQRRRDVRLRPHGPRGPVAADRLAPHEAARRGGTGHQGAAREVGLLPAYHRHARRCGEGAAGLMGAVGLRPMVETDWPAVEKIYRAGIATGHATFESEPPPSWDVFAAGKQPGLMLVAA